MRGYINRQLAINAIENTDCELTADDWDELTNAICNVPSEDVVEVIRCRDCKHADEYYHCDYSAVWNSKNDYCCHGERKDG